MLTKEQLIERKKGIGGSDAAAICGVSKYRTPLKVYLDKITEEVPEEVYNPVFERGNILEPVIRRAFEMRMDMTVDSDLPPFVHRENKFMRVNVDGIIMGIGEPAGDNFWTRPVAVLEVKTSNVWTKDFYLGDVPDDYFVQVQHAMACTNLPMAYIAVLSRDKDYFDLVCRMVQTSPLDDVAKSIMEDIEIFDIPRDDVFISRMIEIQSSFWNNNVLKRIPPDITNLSDLKGLFPKAEKSKKVVATKDILGHLFLRQEYAQQIKKIESMVEAEDKNVMSFMEDAEILISDKGESLASWKNQSRTSLDIQRIKAENPDIYKQFERSSDSRVFRVSSKAIEGII